MAVKDLCIRESYQKNGEEQVSWNKIGILIDGANGKQYVKLHHIPNALISVFEKRKKDDYQRGGGQSQGKQYNNDNQDMGGAEEQEIPLD